MNTKLETVAERTKRTLQIEQTRLEREIAQLTQRLEDAQEQFRLNETLLAVFDAQ